MNQLPLILSCLLCFSWTARAAEARPNIVLILLDNVGQEWFGCYGSPGKRGGDLAVLLSSGFEANKAPTPAGVLPAPQQVTLTQGTLSGSLDLRRRPVPNAGAYEAQKTTNVANPNSWESVAPTTAARVTLEGLTPGTNY